MKAFKTYAYDVIDKDTKEEITVYWCRLAGVDFWMDFGKPTEAGKSPPNKVPADYYELRSEMYEVSIKYYPPVESYIEVEKLN